jgi:hypothetical protein
MATFAPPPLRPPAVLMQDKEMAVFFDALIRTVYQTWDDVKRRSYSEKTLTTDATTTALQRIAIPTDKSVYVDAMVLARRTGGSSGSAGDTAWYRKQAAFKNVAGTVSLVASIVTDQGEDQSAWDCGFSVSGTNAVLVGTGAANNNITWESRISFFEVGV